MTTTTDPKTPGYCVRVAMTGKLCSGTVIASEGGKSLVVTCNHCFSSLNRLTGKWSKGPYPQACRVQSADGSQSYPGTALDGSPDFDLALVFVDATFPVCPLETKPPSVGAVCEHYGLCSSRTTGAVTRSDGSPRVVPVDSFASSCSSCPGDSGAGVLVDGKLVAVNWGYQTGDKQSGTLGVYVSTLVVSNGGLLSAFPAFLAAQRKLSPERPAPVPPAVESPVDPFVPCIPWAGPGRESGFPLFPRRPGLIFPLRR